MPTRPDIRRVLRQAQRPLLDDRADRLRETLMASRAVRKLATRIVRPKGQPTPSPLQVVNGTVTAVTAGAALAHIGDTSPSVAAITVQIGSDTVQAPYLGTAPAVGAVVWVLVGGGPVRVLGVPTGFPTF